MGKNKIFLEEYTPLVGNSIKLSSSTKLHQVPSCLFVQRNVLPNSSPDSGVDVGHPVGHLARALRPEHAGGLPVRGEDLEASGGLLPRHGLLGEEAEVEREAPGVRPGGGRRSPAIVRDEEGVQTVPADAGEERGLQEVGSDLLEILDLQTVSGVSRDIKRLLRSDKNWRRVSREQSPLHQPHLEPHLTAGVLKDPHGVVVCGVPQILVVDAQYRVSHVESTCRKDEIMRTEVRLSSPVRSAAIPGNILEIRIGILFSTPPLMEMPSPPDSPDLATITSRLPGGTSLGMVMSVSPCEVMMSMSSSRVMPR